MKVPTRKVATLLGTPLALVLCACGQDQNGASSGDSQTSSVDAMIGDDSGAVIESGKGVAHDAAVGIDSGAAPRIDAGGIDAGSAEAGITMAGGGVEAGRVDATPGTDATTDGNGDANAGQDASASDDANAGGGVDSGPGTTGATASGVPIPRGWTLKSWDQFGTSGNVTNFQELHAKYYEAQYYNRDNSGLVTIPNTVINGEQETYSHFETAIAWAADHLTIQARGQSNGSITSGEMVSKYAARSFCTEAKYRIPSTMGSWPAFWFYGASSGDSSEIDVEQPITPNQGVSQVSMYNHPSQSNIVIVDSAFTTQYMTWSKSSFNGNSAPHTYTVCYDDSQSSLARYIDGGLIYTATFKWNQSLGGTGHGPDAATIVNLAVGGSWPGNVSNPSSFSDDLELYYLQYFGP